MKLPAVLPESFLRCLSQKERERLGRAAITAQEAITTYQCDQEKELQKQIVLYLDPKARPEAVKTK
jgi:hypothetical protein